MAQPNNCKLSLQALKRREQELRTKEEVFAACNNRLESMAAEKLAAEQDHVAEYNALATE